MTQNELRGTFITKKGKPYSILNRNHQTEINPEYVDELEKVFIKCKDRAIETLFLLRANNENKE